MPKRLINPTLLITLLVLAAIDLWVGTVSISPADLLSTLLGGDQSPVWKAIVWEIRLPRVITGILTGASLAVSGLLMQSLFRNPLAGPDVLGVSSGASLMVALVVLGGLSFGSVYWTTAIAASLGSAAIFLVIASLASRIRSNTSLLIVGLMIGALTSGVVSILQYVAKADDLQFFTLWTMGNISSAGWQEIGILALMLAFGLGICASLMKAINTWPLGDLYARSVGIHLGHTRWKVLIVTSLLTGSVTAFCGPIAFVGIAVPHLVRRLSHTANHQQLIPRAALTGASLILACDLITQLPGEGRILPLNAITALLGAPLIIGLMTSKKSID